MIRQHQSKKQSFVPGAKFLAPALLAAFACGILSSCATTPPAKEITRAEQIQLDNSLGLELTQDFQKQLKLLDAKASVKSTARGKPKAASGAGDVMEVSVYLRTIAQKLATANPDFKDSPVGVLLVDDRKSRDRKWRNYALPGIRIYLSVGLMRSLEFENELAAAMAVELAHISKRHALNRLRDSRFTGVPSRDSAPWDYRVERSSPVGSSQPTAGTGEGPQVGSLGTVHYFGPTGLFTFTEADELAAIEGAVTILYNAGFDPRGLVSLLNRYQNDPKRSPYEEGALERLLERARQSIALQTPLRNPVVRSEAFMNIRKRIQRL